MELYIKVKDDIITMQSSRHSAAARPIATSFNVTEMVKAEVWKML